MIYNFRHKLNTIINKLMKQSLEKNFKLPRNQVSNWLMMYRQVIKQVIDEQDLELWNRTREEWIKKTVESNWS